MVTSGNIVIDIKYCREVDGKQPHPSDVGGQCIQ